MCGRFSLVIKKPKLAAQIAELTDTDLAEILPKFNIAPTQKSFILTSDLPRRLQLFEWGLVPFFAKNGQNTGKMINARVESIFEKTSFQLPIRSRRCLVIADSFYEWKHDPATGKKHPMRIFPKNDTLLIMAGIWDAWPAESANSGAFLRTFSILTCPPNAEMTAIHDRMPLIFSKKENWEAWLDPKIDEKAIENLLKKPENGLLEMYRVPDRLGSTNAEGTDLHERVLENPTLF
jgi:putative SOS response-associated peptidase YedK